MKLLIYFDTIKQKKEVAVIPNVVTHGLMALDVYNKLEDSEVRNAIAKHPKAYLLGSNGPDILFYYKVFPWQDQKLNKKVSLYGNAVHERSINDFYSHALEFINSIKDTNRKSILISYLAGHLMHWALDTLAHPFVFYRSGKIEGETKYWHFRYESMIDSLMLAYVKRKNMNKVNITEFVNVSQEERRVIASFYQMMLSDVFEIDTSPQVIDEAIVGMKNILKFLYDPRNITTPVIKKLEKKLAEPWAFSSHIVNSQLDMHHDILNLSKETWSNPTNIEETSNESFVELYDQSVDLGLTLITALNEVLGGTRFTLNDLLLNRQYDTGRPVGVKMEYFNNIYR